LNHYDVVVTQEDFAYHSDLIRHARHGYRLPPAVSGPRLFGDGLSVLSAYPLASERRVRWEVCRGLFGEANDCFAEKGFSVAALQLTPAAAVDIYNLHADAGSGAGDRQARRAGFAQLAEYIRRHSKDRAVIVAGDMNVQSRHVADRRVLSDFAKQAGLTDACDAMRCGVQRLDRVLFRSSARVRLDAIAYRIDRRFVDTEGAHLSDHLPVGVELRWRVEG
jgi:endonuclease/exonuclease/phosphatase family metal-dependent hydrolase